MLRKFHSHIRSKIKGNLHVMTLCIHFLGGPWLQLYTSSNEYVVVELVLHHNTAIPWYIGRKATKVLSATAPPYNIYRRLQSSDIILKCWNILGSIYPEVWK